MAEIKTFKNKNAEKLNKELMESFERADAYAAEYAEILAKLEFYERNDVQPPQELLDRIMRLMGLRARENRIQKELLRAMGKTPIQDLVDEKKIIQEAWAEVYGLSVVE